MMVQGSRVLNERWLRPVRMLIDEARHLGRSQATDLARVALLRVLTLRWRCLAEIIGQDVARTDPDLRKAYGLLKEAVQTLKAPWMEALDPRERHDWVAVLGEADEALGKIRAEEQARTDRARSVAVLFDELRSIPTRYMLPEDPEGVRLLREGVTELAAYLPLREDLARFSLPYREILGDAFDFLWLAKGRRALERNGEGARSTHLSRREILDRMLGRMIAKHIIGGIHAPIEKILRGFPSHQAGQAKEALDVLCSAGLVVRKFTNYGERVYLDPEPLSTVKAFLAGGTFGIPTLDRWAATDSVSEAA